MAIPAIGKAVKVEAEGAKIGTKIVKGAEEAAEAERLAKLGRAGAIRCMAGQVSGWGRAIGAIEKPRKMRTIEVC